MVCCAERLFFNVRLTSSLSKGMSGVGFFLVCKDLGRVFDNSFPACAFYIYIKKNYVIYIYKYIYI